MTIITLVIHGITGMFELLTARGDLMQFCRASLRENRVAGLAIAGGDFLLRLQHPVTFVVATETAGPILVPYVLWVSAPVGFHLRKKVLPIDVLHFGDEFT